MMSNSEDNTRIAKNTLFLFIRMFFVLVVTLYTSRVILQALGITDYGVYSVVAGFVSMFGFLNATLSSSIQRFYNYELGRSSDQAVQQVYGTGFVIHLALAIIIVILLESLGIWYVNKVMVLPPERLVAAKYLFQVSIFSLVLLVMQIPYVGIIIAHEKMGFYAVVSIIDVSLKLIIALIIKHVSIDRLIVYSILLGGVSIVDFLLYFCFAKSNFTEIRLSKKIDFGLLKSLLSFSGWNLVGSFAYMLKGQGLNLLLNSFFGPVVNAARGIAFQVSNAVSGFSNSITAAFRPQIVQSYAADERQRAINLTFLESKICFVLVATLIVPLCLEIDLILSLWLGDSNIPTQTSAFTCLVLIDSLICALNAPCTHIVFADGRLRNFQIGSSIVHFLLILVSFIFLKLGYPAITVFILTIIFAIINQAVCVIIGDITVHFGIKNYLRRVIIPCFCFIAIHPIIPWLISNLFTDGLVRLALIVLIVILLSLLLGFLILFNKDERQQIMNSPFIKKFILLRLFHHRY